MLWGKSHWLAFLPGEIDKTKVDYYGNIWHSFFLFWSFQNTLPPFPPPSKDPGTSLLFFLLNYPFMTYSWSNICLHCEKLSKTNVLKKLNPSIYIPVIKIYNSYSLNCIWYLLPAALLTAEYLSQKKLLKWSLGQSTTLTVDG